MLDVHPGREPGLHKLVIQIGDTFHVRPRIRQEYPGTDHFLLKDCEDLVQRRALPNKVQHRRATRWSRPQGFSKVVHAVGELGHYDLWHRERPGSFARQLDSTVVLVVLLTLQPIVDQGERDSTVIEMLSGFIHRGSADHPKTFLG